MFPYLYRLLGEVFKDKKGEDVYMSKSQYDSVAEQYEKMRPEYPIELIDSLITNTGVNVKSRLLEIGAGTGKATTPLAKKGYKIDCIEIEPKMAEILESKCNKFSNISVIVDNFETWENTRSDKYNLIYSAQAFHWIDEKIKYKKCHSLLKDNGKMALFWYFSILESKDIFNILNSIFQKYNTGYACTGIDDCHKFFSREKSKLESESIEFFKNVNEYIFEGIKMEQDAELFIKRFNTTSAFASLDKQTKILINKELNEAINLNGGTVNSRVIYMLYIVDKA